MWLGRAVGLMLWHPLSRTFKVEVAWWCQLGNTKYASHDDLVSTKCEIHSSKEAE